VTDRLVGLIVGRPRATLATCLALVLVPAVFAPGLRKDTRNDAFMPADHPVLASRERVRALFGLADPMVIAVIREGPNGVFTPGTLALVAWLTERVRALPDVERDSVRSLATEHAIVGAPEGLRVERLMERPPTQPAAARAVRTLVMSQRALRGRLVATDGTATVIVAELRDERRAQAVYAGLLALAAEAPRGDATLHVAGEGATDGYVGAYIDADAQRLNPLAGVVIALVLLAAYRTWLGVLLPSMVAVGALAVTLGIMAACDVPFYLITSAMTVILIGIAVCDAIHLLGEFYERRAAEPDAPRAATVAATMRTMWRPIVVTSLTSMAGFLAMGMASFMPPLRAFGLFGALGVLVAMLLSLSAVPAVLLLVPGRPSRVFAGHRRDVVALAIAAVGRGVAHRPRLVVAVALLAAGTGLVGASRLHIDDERIRSFRPEEPIVRADRAIAARLGGTNNLDVLVDGGVRDAFYSPDLLGRLEAFEADLRALPGVTRTDSIVEYVKQMHRAMHEDDPAYDVLPDDRNLIAQYFLLYSMAGDVADLDHALDAEARHANVRVVMRRGRWSDFARVVEPTRRLAERHFAGSGVVVEVSGSGTARYQRAIELRRDHPRGVALAFLAVLGTTTVAFGSLRGGLLCLLPVALSVLGTYALMGFTGIWLGLGTSMAAAIAVGLGVDFAVHTVSRLRDLTEARGLAIPAALERLYPTTGRALLFNFAAVCFGFGVLGASRVPAIGHFGRLVAVCVAAGFVAALTVLPAVVQLLGPRSLGPRASRSTPPGRTAIARPPVDV
jgi:predicted RND superfamily exporter protein